MILNACLNFFFTQIIDKSSVNVDEQTHAGLLTIMASKTSSVNELSKLFWAEQLKNIQKDPKGYRWSDDMIRIAILLQSRGPAAYDMLRETGLLLLPSGQTLRDYTNYLEPEQGILKEVGLNMQYMMILIESSVIKNF